jgi:threonine synthase
MSYEIKCTKCKRLVVDPLKYKCFCGSPLETHVIEKFDKMRIRKYDRGLWRYRPFFSYVNKNEIVSLGEGWTPLVKFDENLYFKLEYLNPTGSFKDRGSAILISAVHRFVRAAKGYISEDSSGNAGASIAAYAARAGLKAKIYVPATVSGQKFNQVLFYGAHVQSVKGERNKIAAEAQSPERGKFYVGHIWHPVFRDGIRSLAYEIVEQCEWKLPSRIYLPVSAGTLLLGFIEGLGHLMDSGIIDELPVIVACQTVRVSPLYHRLKNLPYTPPRRITSIADALISPNPPLLELMVRKMRQIKGEVEIVDEKQISESFVELASKGFFVEPSSAVAYAAYKKQVESAEKPRNEKTIIILTGTGLKTKLKP